jgi:hypothetical protein
LSLSNEQLGKLRRHRAISKVGRTFNAFAGCDLSPLSCVRGCGELAFGVDLGCRLGGCNDELPLSFDAGCALVLPVTDEVARGSTSDADNHC